MQLQTLKKTTANHVEGISQAMRLGAHAPRKRWEMDRAQVGKQANHDVPDSVLAIYGETTALRMAARRLVESAQESPLDRLAAQTLSAEARVRMAEDSIIMATGDPQPRLTRDNPQYQPGEKPAGHRDTQKRVYRANAVLAHKERYDAATASTEPLGESLDILGGYSLLGRIYEDAPEFIS